MHTKTCFDKNWMFLKLLIICIYKQEGYHKSWEKKMSDV